jgi:hypothetical protein
VERQGYATDAKSSAGEVIMRGIESPSLEIAPYVVRDRHAPCQYHDEFQAWCTALIELVQRDPTLETIQVAQKQLQDKYHEYRTTLKPAHRDNVTHRGHRCVWHVYHDTYWLFRNYELRYIRPALKVAVHGQSLPEEIYLGMLIDGDEQGAVT